MPLYEWVSLTLFSQRDKQHAQWMLSCDNVLHHLYGWRLDVLYNSQSRLAGDFSLQWGRLSWAKLDSSFPTEPCWQVRSCCLFPVQFDLWVRMTDWKPLLTCPAIPLHSEGFFTAPHPRWSYKRRFLLVHCLVMIFSLVLNLFFPLCMLSWKQHQIIQHQNF